MNNLYFWLISVGDFVLREIRSSPFTLSKYLDQSEASRFACASTLKTFMIELWGKKAKRQLSSFLSRENDDDGDERSINIDLLERIFISTRDKYRSDEKSTGLNIRKRRNKKVYRINALSTSSEKERKRKLFFRFSFDQMFFSSRCVCVSNLVRFCHCNYFAFYSVLILFISTVFSLLALLSRFSFSLLRRFLSSFSSSIYKTKVWMSVLPVSFSFPLWLK